MAVAGRNQEILAKWEKLKLLFVDFCKSIGGKPDRFGTGSSSLDKEDAVECVIGNKSILITLNDRRITDTVVNPEIVLEFFDLDPENEYARDEIIKVETEPERLEMHRHLILKKR